MNGCGQTHSLHCGVLSGRGTGRGLTARPEESPGLEANSHTCPLPLNASLFYAFPTMKPAVWWIRGAPESWGHLWSPRHDGHHSLCTDHTTLCGRQLWALEHPFEEEDAAGHMGGETLFFLSKTQDLAPNSGIDFTLQLPAGVSCDICERFLVFQRVGDMCFIMPWRYWLVVFQDNGIERWENPEPFCLVLEYSCNYSHRHVSFHTCLWYIKLCHSICCRHCGDYMGLYE